MLLAEVIALSNALMGLGIGVVNLEILLRNRVMFRWARVLQMLIGFYWFGVYMVILVSDPSVYQTPMFSQVFIRSGITFTLAVMLTAAVLRRKT